MVKEIKVGELRQNPTPMLDDVQNGDEYVVTSHARPIARVVPIGDDARWTHNRDRVLDVLRRVHDPELAEIVAQGRAATTGADL